MLVQNSTNTSFATVKLQQSSGSGGYFSINKLGTSSGAIGGANAAQVWQSGNAPIIFGVNNTEEVRFQSGGGISFNGDTAAANALDDYEEGSWTPSFTGLDSGSANIRHAKYTKIGRMVFVQGYITISSTSNNDFKMSMPFTQVSGNIYAPLMTQTTVGDSSYLALRIQNGSSESQMKDMQDDDSRKTYNTLNGKVIMFSGSYEAG